MASDSDAVSSIVTSPASLIVTVDFKDPYSYLALAPTLALVEALAVDCRFVPFLVGAMKAPKAPGPDADRGTLHRARRAAYYQQDLVRYAGSQQLPARHLATDQLYRQTGGEVAAMALNLLGQTAANRVPELMTKIFRGYWDADLSLDSVEDLRRLLAGFSGAAADFPAYCASAGVLALNRQRDELIDAGCFSSPSYLIGDDVYLGRAHLPLIRARLTGVVT